MLGGFAMNNKLQGKDLINIGIFTAIYFIVIFAAASIGFIPIFIPLISVIVPLVDATNIERNLYLTMQLMELDVPMVLALNMMDEVRQNGGSVRVNQMEEALGIPVVPISAAKNEGIDELVAHAIHVAKYQ